MPDADSSGGPSRVKPDTATTTTDNSRQPKLYRLERTVVAYAWGTRDEITDGVRQWLDEESRNIPDDEFEAVAAGDHIAWSERGSLVYHSDSGDLSLAECLARTPGFIEREEKWKADAEAALAKAQAANQPANDAAEEVEG